MISLDEARSRILSTVSTSETVDIALADAVGLVAASDVVSGVAVPPFDNSAMDGYAVRASDCTTLPVELPVVATASAGHPADGTVGPGEAARILTGAVMVAGADTVVPVEHTDGGTDTVRIDRVGPVGANIRRSGEDVSAGTVVIEAGTRLTPAHLGAAATVGCGTLGVHRRPRVAVVSTGDELVQPGGGPLAPGQIFESNRIVLSAILRQDFGLEARNISLPDDAEVVSQTLEELAGSCDLILSSGGVSMGGEFDVVKVALDGFGVEFWQVSIKPAKPLGFGRIGEAVFFGLPGNPVSSIVSFELFVRPALRRMLGIDPAVPPTVRMVAGEPLKRGDDGKVHFARVALGADGRVRSAGGQGSHIMSGLAAADALAVLGPDTLEVAEGEELDAIPLRGVR